MIFDRNKSELPHPMSVDDVKQWVSSVPWTDTMCGGEYHQFTFRTSVCERKFLRMAEFIRSHGYDGDKYYNVPYRYLDFEGFFYFTCGEVLQTTWILNRKPLRGREPRLWCRNRVNWKPLNAHKFPKS